MVGGVEGGSKILLSPSLPDGEDRRSSPRFSLPDGQLTGEIQGATLLNLSRRGMAIVVPVSSTLSPGAVYRMTLLDPSDVVEVESQVRWVRTEADQQGEPGEEAPAVQIAGLGFKKILTREPRGTWRQLMVDPESVGEKIADSGEGVPQETKPVRVIEMVTPLDGVDLEDSLILVTCKISDPEEVSSLSVNGVEADVDGRMVRARVDLEPGLNSLRALVWRLDGSYRSYFLGRVNRKVSS